MLNLTLNLRFHLIQKNFTFSPFLDQAGGTSSLHSVKCCKSNNNTRSICPGFDKHIIHPSDLRSANPESGTRRYPGEKKTTWHQLALLTLKDCMRHFFEVTLSIEPACCALCVLSWKTWQRELDFYLRSCKGDASLSSFVSESIKRMWRRFWIADKHFRHIQTCKISTFFSNARIRIFCFVIQLANSAEQKVFRPKTANQLGLGRKPRKKEKKMYEPKTILISAGSIVSVEAQ